MDPFTGGGGAGAQTGGGGSAGLNLGGNGGSAAGGGVLNTTPDCSVQSPGADLDADGFTPAQGDCNDCTAQMNPGAFDYPGNGVDEDCNGAPDDEPVSCDQTVFDLGYGDPMIAAEVIGLCRRAAGQSWGVVSAKYVKADGSAGMNDLSHGLLSGFGPNVQPRSGLTMLVLSSGSARRPGDPGYSHPEAQDPFNVLDMGTTGFAPGGYPKDSPSCGGVQTSNDKVTNDPAALELVIKAPSNANQFEFDFNFYTWEYPGYVCTQYNDFFVALVDPSPPNALDGNVSFDSEGNPVSVNNGLLQVCSPGSAGGKTFTCPLGTAQLQGTGFEPGAATGWLRTTSPIPGGQTIRLRFAIWDMGDHALNSTVLIDNFTWSIGEGAPPKTAPVPE